MAWSGAGCVRDWRRGRAGHAEGRCQGWSRQFPEIWLLHVPRHFGPGHVARWTAYQCDRNRLSRIAPAVAYAALRDAGVYGRADFGSAGGGYFRLLGEHPEGPRSENA